MTDLVYSPMELMEIHLRSLATSMDEFNTNTNVFDNSGLMVRQMKIKAGEIILGKIHNEWNVNILASGSLYVMADPSKDKVKITAPHVFETGPNSQKLGFAITDCVFMNVMRSEPGEKPEEAVSRMTKESRVTKQIEKETLWQ
ncbi:MAG: hypothetical protein DRI37_07535 [Chloroflexi bacterium]|nr:MAG: hypothetical protein DRI37_07535 [Chloroflexota bacterium]